MSCFSQDAILFLNIAMARNYGQEAKRLTWILNVFMRRYRKQYFATGALAVYCCFNFLITGEPQTAAVTFIMI